MRAAAGSPRLTQLLILSAAALNVARASTCDIHTALATCASAPPPQTGGEHDTGKELCENACMKGLMDCADDPSLASVLSAHQVEANKALRDGCAKGGVIDCMDELDKLQPMMHKGGKCCPPGGECNDPVDSHDIKPPTNCSQACAGVFMPMWRQCSDSLLKVLRTAGVETKTERATERAFHQFAIECRKTAGSGH